ncbi:VOC family protein [Erythrobacter litoralis]|uniref:VOC family protein n=1 Tax=Erythrobacter litoralis TaxID=39960 RepID=UPI0024357E1B|nr:VOC family protein [Erythrobacter litoralis]MDG6078852.1 VOC family protein [Erythrobacter litoralis]
MSDTDAALFTFVKLTVNDIDAATRFFVQGFGMTHADTVDTPAFREHVMTGKKGSATIVLFHWKDGRAVEIGNGYGPVGMITRDLEIDLARAIDAGATQKGKTVNFGSARIAFVLTPEGHEIEMMQMGSAPEG